MFHRLPRIYLLRYKLLYFIRDALNALADIPKFKKRSIIFKSLPKLNVRHAVVICGGPSYSNKLSTYLESIRDHIDIYVVNFYSENSSSSKIIPNYYFLSDPAHLRENTVIGDRTKKLLDYIKENQITIAIPFSKKWISLTGGIRRIFFNDVESISFGGTSPLYPRSYPSNTSFKAIAFASSLPYSTVAILGLDYNYPQKIFLDSHGKLILRDEHHYGVKDTDYSPIFESVGHALSWWAEDYIGLKKLNKPNIFNISDVSLVDAFKILSPEDYLSGALYRA